MGTRAVTQHVDQLVQKCDYSYIETPVNRIYLQFVQHVRIFGIEVVAYLCWKPFTSRDYSE